MTILWWWWNKWGSRLKVTDVDVVEQGVMITFSKRLGLQSRARLSLRDECDANKEKWNDGMNGR